MAMLMKGQIDCELQASWGNIEKETLKKYLLIYGYGRWGKIREACSNSCKMISEKPMRNIRAFSNDFVRTLFENLQTEKNELKGFLLHLLRVRKSDPFV